MFSEYILVVFNTLLKDVDQPGSTPATFTFTLTKGSSNVASIQDAQGIHLTAQPSSGIANIATTHLVNLSGAPFTGAL